MYTLKIDGHAVDFKDDISIKFNYSNSDTTDPAAVKNSFSYTVKLPGTFTNNKIFGDIWKCNRQLVGSSSLKSMSNFNPKKKVPFTLAFDGELVESGYVKLNRVTSNFFMQEYEITLYGGIGDFFYSLQTNEDGTKRSLADLYYGFSPAINISEAQRPFTEEEEMNSILYKWSAENIAHSWHMLAAMAAPTAATRVDNFITAVPCYTGLYENFDSATMLVENSFRYDSLISSANLQTWDQSLPTSFTEDNVFYSLYQDPLSPSKATYSKIEYPRDIDGIEAGDLRVTELPIAIKLSKVLDAISASGNNGGYTVNYSSSITSSDYWKYGWIMLEKPDFDTTNVTNPMSIANCYAEGCITPNQGPQSWMHNNVYANVAWEENPNDTTQIADPYIEIVFDNNITTFDAFMSGETIDYSKLSNISNNCNWGHIVQNGTPGQGPNITSFVPDGCCWHGLFCLIELYDGSTLMEQYGTLFHVHNIIQGFGRMGFGQDYLLNIPQSSWKPIVLSRVNSYFSTSLADFTVHDGLQTVVNDDMTVSYKTPVLETLPCNFTSLDFKIKITPLPICYIYADNGDISVARIPYIDPLQQLDSVGDYSKSVRIQTCPWHWGLRLSTSTPAFSYYEYARYLNHRLDIQFNSSMGYINGVVSSTNFYYQVNATKKNLLSNSLSPFEALTSFTKMLNLKYIYDKTAKRIDIVTSREYWINQVVDLDGRVDYNADLSHNLILSNSKYIDFSYDKNDTYPLYLWRKSNDKEYEAFSFDTGLEFNSDKQKLFENKYKQVTLYTPKSQFFKTWHQCLPSIFGTNVFEYTLFNTGIDGSINEETIKELTGNEDPNAKRKGMGMICLFDKGQKQQSSVFPSLLFLNGFYKNWRSIPSSEADSNVDSNQNDQDANCKIVVPVTIVSDDFWAMDTLNSDRCWLWCYNRQSGYFPGWGYSFEHAAACWAMPFFTRDLTCYSFGSTSWHSAGSVRASWDMTYDYTKYYDEKTIDIVRYPNTIQLASTAVTEPATFKMSDLDKTDDSNYIYNKFWRTQTEDMYDDNSRELEVMIDLRGDDPTDALRRFYKLNGCVWIIEKIDGYEHDIVDRNFCKCKLLKVKDTANYINLTKAENTAIGQEVEEDIKENQANWERAD